MSIPERLGVNRAVLARSVARLGDAIGNSILFIIIPLYVSELPAPWLRCDESARVGILISLYGIVNSALQPVMGALSDRFQHRKAFILAGLFLMGAGTFLFMFATRFVSFGLGIAAGPLIAGVLAVVSFELPFLIGGGLSLIAAWIVYRFVPEGVHRHRRPQDAS